MFVVVFPLILGIDDDDDVDDVGDGGHITEKVSPAVHADIRQEGTDDEEDQRQQLHAAVSHADDEVLVRDLRADGKAPPQGTSHRAEAGAAPRRVYGPDNSISGP